jgi:hypothetical protein
LAHGNQPFLMRNIMWRRAYSVNQTNKLIVNAFWESFMLREREETVVLRGQIMVSPDMKAILQAAVRMEEQSYTLYTIAQRKVEHSSSKKMLKELAQEELKHKEKLLAVIRNERKTAELGATAKVQDLKIVDAIKEYSFSRRNVRRQLTSTITLWPRGLRARRQVNCFLGWLKKS